jgi:Tfp pilus assembly protein FimV
MSVITALFFIALASIGAGAVTGIAKAVAGRGAARADVAELTALVRQYATDLDDAQGVLASQAAQLAELQERMDFAERLLTQVRERKALGGVEPEGRAAPGS